MLKRYYRWEVLLTLVSTARFQDGDGSLNSVGRFPASGSVACFIAKHTSEGVVSLTTATIY
jgi:hypothetical protein